MPLPEARNTSAFRLGQPAVPHLPLRVRSTGHYNVAGGWSEPPVKKWFVELTWTVSGEGEALIGDRYFRLKPGDIHLYFPGETHHLRALGKPDKRWRYHWITFDHAEAERWLGGFNLARHTTARDPCPQSLFKSVADALLLGTAEGERQAARHAHDILLAASATSPASTPEGTLADRARLLMEENFADPRFDMTALASRLQVHRSTLFRRFLAAYAITPSAHLLNLRLQRGLALLQTTALPVQEIAVLAGFTDPGYFSRAIRKATGRPPGRFRNH